MLSMSKQAASSLQVFNPERDIARIKSGVNDNEAYMSVTGVKVESGGKEDNHNGNNDDDDDQASDDDGDDSGSDSGDDDDDQKSSFKNSHRPRDESPNSKKVKYCCPGANLGENT